MHKQQKQVDIQTLNKETTSNDKLIQLSSIFQAYKKLKTVVKRTNIQKSLKLSDLYKANIYFKREDLQVVGTYKVRGVFNRICQLTDEQKNNGIYCASVGNHAQSVAYVCNYLKINCTIFMPNSTQATRIDGVKEFGKEYTKIELYGDTFEESHTEAENRSKHDGTTFIHAYDDDQIIAGQGTIAIEILEDIPEENIDILIFPVGGGSVGSGLVSYFKQMSPSTILIGCEPENAPQMHLSLTENHIVDLTKKQSFTNKIITKKAGKLTYEILSQVLNDVILVPEGQICSVMMKLFNEEGMLVERAGALTIGALDSIKDQIAGKTIVCLISGLNSDLGKMNDIRMLSEMHKGLQYYLFISFYTKPGALKQFLLECLTPNDEITNFDYTKKNNREKGPALVGIRVKHPEEFEAITKRMEQYKISYKILDPNQEIFRLLL